MVFAHDLFKGVVEQGEEIAVDADDRAVRQELDHARGAIDGRQVVLRPFECGEQLCKDLFPGVVKLNMA